jgi:hypothetical protein
MGRESGPKPKHAVIVLLDDRKNVGHVGVRRLDRPARWETVWRLKDQIDTPLAHWLRTLDRKPREVVLVGSLGLGGRIARAIVALVAGWFGQENPLSNAGRRGRPTARIEPDGTLRCWPSRSAASRDLKVSRWVVRRRVRAGKMFDLG